MSFHSEWMNLIEFSGPFLADKVLDDAFPQGFEGIDALKKKRLRQAYNEWREALDDEGDDVADIHEQWISFVLSEILEFQVEGSAEILKRNVTLASPITHLIPEYGVRLEPDWVVQQGDAKPLFLVRSFDRDANFQQSVDNDGWAASPLERMVILCRASGIRLGLLTNGEEWTLVHASDGNSSTFVTWHADLWLQEPITLQVFTSLIGMRTMFGEFSRQLPALLEESSKHQDEVTDELSGQVIRAVEVLIQALDRADKDKNRELLLGIEPREIYESALTVMMRIVFLLAAEERGLMLMGNLDYESYYAVSTLRMQLRQDADEVLERRHDSWARLLAIFRAVYGGIEHETLRLPALGGSLFDPDRFPFLEGRIKGTHWKTDQALPLPIDNHTVLLIMEAVQTFKGRTLSYETLDVEQIGYVYEGLLERTVVRAPEATLDLRSKKDAENPWVTLAELEGLVNNPTQLLELLVERTGSSSSRITNDLTEAVGEEESGRLLSICQGDQALHGRLKRYFHLLRKDSLGYPLVYPKGTFMVIKGSDRRDTGTHYTPKVLTQKIVETTLTPLVYTGPAEGRAREEWKLKAASELLDLRVCDPAMGSGAFLVQICRFLSERVVEAWKIAEAKGSKITADGIVVDDWGSREPLSSNADDRLDLAKGLIAEKCLYGVDMNPLAVELAKVSIWLTTLSKGRPFGFLDHNLKSGDSLLGISDIRQLHYLDLGFGPGSSKKLFASNVDEAVKGAIELRTELRSRPIRDIQDVEYMSDIDRQARQKLSLPITVADALIGECLAAGNGDVNTATLGIDVGEAIGGDEVSTARLRAKAGVDLKVDLQQGKTSRKPFHWPLEFPEVFGRENGGFDVIVGNPPFLGGSKISGTMGTRYRNYLERWVACQDGGHADLVAYFFLRIFKLLRNQGCTGLLAVNTIAEGDTRQVGLERLVREPFGATIFCAYPNEPWPGRAAVVTSRIHMKKGMWNGTISLSGNTVSFISPFLSDQDEWTPHKLKCSQKLSFEGSKLTGKGFILTELQAQKMIADDPRNREVIFSYLNGDDLNSRPNQKPSRWVINFWDWPEDRACQYRVPYQTLLEKVKPERQRRDEDGEYKLRSPLPEKWWIYGEKRPALYHKIGRGHSFEQHPREWDGNLQAPEKVIVTSRHCRYFIFSLVPNSMIFSDATVVFASGAYTWLALLQSGIHEVWAKKHSSSLGETVRYTPSDIFETFPLPNEFENSSGIANIGERYHLLRSRIAIEKQIGLTDLYNLFHDPDNIDPDIIQFRALQRELDLAIAGIYGWSDLNFEHGFHQSLHLQLTDRTFFGLSRDIGIEVLKRLSKLNRQRYEEESSQEKNVKSTTRASKGATKKKTNSETVDLFQILDDRAKGQG